jgi:hypothetical protein
MSLRAYAFMPEYSLSVSIIQTVSVLNIKGEISGGGGGGGRGARGGGGGGGVWGGWGGGIC